MVMIYVAVFYFKCLGLPAKVLDKYFGKKAKSKLLGYMEN